MVYQKRGSKTWWTRVTDCDGVTLLCSTGTRSKTTAAQVEAWHKGVRARLDPLAILSAITRRDVKLADAYRLGETRARGEIDALADDAADIDLAPLLSDWARSRGKRDRGAASTPKYLDQIGVLFPERPWRFSTVTVPVVVARLDALPVKDATKNRYRAALSAFCSWLVRRGTLAQNPARLAGGYTEVQKPIRFMPMTDAQRVLERLPAEYQGREAMMAGCGADWSDTERVRVRDIDLKAGTIRCHGSKSPWRNRVVRITQDWTIPYIRAALKGKHPDALVFSGIERTCLRVHKRACRAAKVLVTTLHEWRDTYAVAELQAGEYATIVAHQLGHKDPSLLWSRYGRYVPQAKDYREAREAASATKSATLRMERHA